jgi:hypothetical protein
MISLPFTIPETAATNGVTGYGGTEQPWTAWNEGRLTILVSLRYKMFPKKI